MTQQLEREIVRRELELRKQAEGYQLVTVEVCRGRTVYPAKRWAKPVELRKEFERQRLHLLDLQQDYEKAVEIQEDIKRLAKSSHIQPALDPLPLPETGKHVIAGGKVQKSIDGKLHEVEFVLGDGGFRVWYQIEGAGWNPLGDALDIEAAFDKIVRPFFKNPADAVAIWQRTAGGANG